MKVYTTIEQSKKLVKFLPPKSADMFYGYGMDIHTKKWDYDVVPTIIDVSNQIDIGDIPCWSLAALLDSIPVIVEYNGTFIRLRIDKGPIGNDEYAMWYEDLQTNLSTDIGTEANNFIDACYEMIIKLRELNLL